MTEGPQSGFTLVEMLVSLALTALIAMLLVQALQATGTVTRGVGRMAAHEEVQAVREHLRRLLRDDLAGRPVTGRRPPVVGRPDGIDAVVAGNRAWERGSQQRVSLAAVPRPDAGFDLVETRALAFGDQAPDPPDPLLDRVAGLRLRYFGAAGAAAPLGWQETWTRRDRPPALVEVSVAFLPGDARRWPPLVLTVGSGL